MPFLRLFIAIETPADIKEQIAVICKKLQTADADVRWEPPAKFHTTLRFLGPTNPDLLPEIVSILERLCNSCPPMQIRYSGIGCFPSLKRPRSIWIGVHEESGELARLQLAINQALNTLGFQQEDKAFSPHVTLGRIKGLKNINPLLAIMESTTFESQPTVASHVDLLKSELHSEGSVYTILNKFSLRG